MKEFTVDFKAFLKNGLKKETKISRNTPFLETSQGLVASEQGLIKPDEIRSLHPLLSTNDEFMNEDFSSGLYTWIGTPGWSVAAGKLVHTTGTTGYSCTSLAFIPSHSYSISYTISDYVSGSVQVGLGATLGTARSANGTHTETIKCPTLSPRIGFTPSNTFDAKIDSLIVYDSVTHYTFPYPMIFKGERTTLIVTDTEVYTYDELTNTATKLATYDAHYTHFTRVFTVLSTMGFTGAAAWRFADFQTSWFLTNNGVMMIYTPQFGGKVVVCDQPRFQVCCKHNNRLIMGSATGSLGEDKVVNGCFDTNPTEWTYDATWTWDSTYHNNMLVGSGTGALKQNISAVAGTVYHVRYTIMAGTGGTVTPYVGSAGSTGNKGTARGASGSYEEDITCVGSDGEIGFIPTSGSGIRVANVQVRAYGATYFDGTQWATIFNLWKKYAPADQITYSGQFARLKFVFWSSPAGGDLDYPFLLELLMFGISKPATFTKLLPVLEQAIRNRDIGMIEIPTNGSVRAVLPLGQYVIVYSDDQIGFLRWTEEGYKYQRIVWNGVGFSSCVGGDETEHVFIDRTGILWRLDSNLQMTKLGYQWIFSKYTPTVLPLIMKDPNEGTVFISDADGTLELRGNCLGTRVGLIKTGVILAYNSTDQSFDLASLECGSAVSGYDWTDPTYPIVIKTCTFDLGLRALKTIHQVSIGITDIKTAYARLHYRMKPGDSFSQTAYVPFNDEGVAVFETTALEFQLEIAAAYNGDNSCIDDLEISVKATDKRFTRGIGMGEPNAG